VAKVTAIPGWQRALILLAGTVVGVVVITALYWAQVVFVPLALSVFLTFLLSPLVKFLQQHHVGRLPAVVLVVLLVASLLGGLGWVAERQVTGLLGELPNYTANIKAKIKSLQDLFGGSARLGHMVDEITRQLKKEKSGSPDQVPAPAGAAGQQPTAVVLQPNSPVWIGRLPGYLGTAPGHLHASET
jgi:predicted PurR-regulated permease PerM